MKVISRATMPNGTPIQIEDWNENYNFMPYASTIAAYPKSKVSHPGSFAPKGNEAYRFEFDFDSQEETESAFEKLISGQKKLADFSNMLSEQKYADCL